MPNFMLDKKNSRCIKIIHVKSNNAKPLEESLGESFYDIAVGENFLNRTGKIQVIKEDIDRHYYIKLKLLYDKIHLKPREQIV